MLRRPPLSPPFPYTTLFRSDCYRTLHPTSSGYTSHTDYPAFRVDYIFASPSFASRLSACEVVTGPEEGEAKIRSEEHTSELQSRQYLVCRLLLEKKK